MTPPGLLISESIGIAGFFVELWGLGFRTRYIKHGSFKPLSPVRNFETSLSPCSRLEGPEKNLGEHGVYLLFFFNIAR
jgi:hypothetical protein